MRTPLLALLAFAPACASSLSEPNPAPTAAVTTNALAATSSPSIARAPEPLALIPDAGHMTYIEQPGIYFSAIRRFFAQSRDE